MAYAASGRSIGPIHTRSRSDRRRKSTATVRSILSASSARKSSPTLVTDLPSRPMMRSLPRRSSREFIEDFRSGQRARRDPAHRHGAVERRLGQQVVVINQPGAGGALCARAGAPPDGATLFMPVSSAFVTMKGAAPNIPIAVPADFAPISLIGEQPMFITIAPTGIEAFAGLDRSGKAEAGRNFLRRLRARPSKPSHRRDVARGGRITARWSPIPAVRPRR